MSRAALDRLLAALVAAILVTGVLTWRAGSVDTHWLYVVHGVLSGALMGATALKLRRSLPRAIAARHGRELLIAVPLALTTLGALLIGFAWVAGGRYIEIGPWTVLGWHGILGWAVVVLTVVHMLARRRWRVLRPRRPAPKRAHATGRVISRRGLMATGALAVTGVAIWGVAETLDRLGAQPRRFTGSRWLPNGGIPPPTTFFGEGVPQIDAASWRVRIHGKVDRTVELSLAELEELGLTSEEHVLDCTGGWAMRTVWAGVPMATALHAAAVWPSATTVNVRSVTGWGASLPIDEARGTMLATHVSGQPLPNANGAPCRLIVPNRRGLDWVKWVHEIEVA